MRKVLFHLNCLEQGGAERTVSNLANELSKQGYEVIVATQWQGENEFPLDDSVRRIHVGLKKDDEKRSQISRALRRILYLRKLIQKEKPDVTIAFARKAIYRSLFATRFTKQPVIIAVRTNPVGYYDEKKYKLLIPLLLERAAGAVFQTKDQRDFFPDKIGKKSTIIYNPINPKYVNVAKVEKKEKVIAHSSRIVGLKNQEMLIRAFMQVLAKHPDYSLKIYGTDSGDGTWEKLETLIKENHLEEKVFLMGGCDSLETELPKAEIYAFPSDEEGLPNALLEAMALGLPVISTDCPCGGPATVIEHEKNGLLVPIKDADAMASAIIRLIEDKALAERLGKEAEKIKTQLDGQTIIGQWKSYIEKVITKKTN